MRVALRVLDDSNYTRCLSEHFKKDDDTYLSTGTFAIMAVASILALL